jgi:hypothetical protein
MILLGPTISRLYNVTLTGGHVISATDHCTHVPTYFCLHVNPEDFGSTRKLAFSFGRIGSDEARALNNLFCELIPWLECPN